MDNDERVRISERALIGSVLRDGTKYGEAREIVNSGDFGIIIHGLAWEAMENLYKNGRGIDIFTVADELERMGRLNDFSFGIWSGSAYLSQLRGDGDPRNVMTYAETVQNLSAKRQLDLFFQKCVVWAKNGREPLDIIKDVNAEIGKMTLYKRSDEFTVPFSVAASEAYDETDAASRGKNKGILTGLVDVDRILGSLLPGNLYIVAARPGQGKTAFLLTVAKYAAEHGKRVGIFSLEMSRTQVAQRIISQYSGIPLDRIIKGKMSVEEWERYTKAFEEVCALPIVINDLSSIDIDSIRQTARKIKSNGGLDFIVLDYIQLANTTEKKQNRELEVSAISRGLKYLSSELDVPVLAASQLSREIEKRGDRRPILSDLRESGSLEQDSYAVMFIYRPDDKRPQNTELIIAKHRNGPVGTVDLYFKAELTQFESAINKIFHLNE